MGERFVASEAVVELADSGRGGGAGCGERGEAHACEYFCRANVPWIGNDEAWAFVELPEVFSFLFLCCGHADSCLPFRVIPLWAQLIRWPANYSSRGSKTKRASRGEVAMSLPIHPEHRSKIRARAEAELSVQAYLEHLAKASNKARFV